MVAGFNHLTLAVSDLDRSFEFYVDVLGFNPEGRWDEGAYLSADSLWLCLSLGHTSPANDYTHYAFSVDKSQFQPINDRILDVSTNSWKANTSEGMSHYFLDPDGHKLEIHCGSLLDRLASIENNPYSGWKKLSQR